MASYDYRPFAYSTPPELSGEATTRKPVVIVGAGPVGLAAAIDLALHDIPVVVLDDSDVVSVGSRAICWAKRTLEIFDRLGIGQRVVDKGVTWNVGRVFHGDAELYKFDLLPEPHHRRPAFVNLQQYYVEEYLVERAGDFPHLIDLRWKNEVVGVAPQGGGVSVSVRTPDGDYTLETDWLLACDGARSPVRTMLGLPFEGQRFEERFLIADVRMKADYPTERLFWFKPSFHPGESALMHRQADDVFRIDFQLGPDADPDAEREPERVMRRVAAVVGDTPVELEWCSVYSFRCAQLEKFVHGRVVFVGDSAHVVSPFGARGGNGGIQDSDNLCWKLAFIVKGDAPVSLIDTYDEERIHGARENILNSSRTTNFMTPKSRTEHLFRDAVLTLAKDRPFARALLNAGRLSKPCALTDMSLQTSAAPPDGLAPGAVCVDAPVRTVAGESWLLEHLGGDFVLLSIGESAPTVDGVRSVTVGDVAEGAMLADHRGVVRERYGTGHYLIRPDAHVAARFDRFDAATVTAALARAKGGVASNVRVAA